VGQLEENLAAVDQGTFTREELTAISSCGDGSDINIWAASSAEPRTDSFSAIRPGV